MSDLRGKRHFKMIWQIVHTKIGLSFGLRLPFLFKLLGTMLEVRQFRFDALDQLLHCSSLLVFIFIKIFTVTA